MKIYSTVLAVLLVAANVSAQSTQGAYFSQPERYQQLNPVSLERSFIACLSIDNDGVVESALAHVAMMTLAVRGNNFEALKIKVAEVARTVSSQELQYKAFLTKVVLEDPEAFNSLAAARYESPDELFGAIANTLSVRYTVQ